MQYYMERIGPNMEYFAGEAKSFEEAQKECIGDLTDRFGVGAPSGVHSLLWIARYGAVLSEMAYAHEDDDYHSWSFYVTDSTSYSYAIMEAGANHRPYVEVI